MSIAIVLPDWPDSDGQTITLGRARWRVSRLHALTKDFPISELPLLGMNLSEGFYGRGLRWIAKHHQLIQAADLSYPIILDEDGEVMDGRHRIVKALVNGHETIKAVRFSENPTPCEILNP